VKFDAYTVEEDRVILWKNGKRIGYFIIDELIDKVLKWKEKS